MNVFIWPFSFTPRTRLSLGDLNKDDSEKGGGVGRWVTCKKGGGNISRRREARGEGEGVVVGGRGGEGREVGVLQETFSCDVITSTGGRRH